MPTPIGRDTKYEPMLGKQGSWCASHLYGEQVSLEGNVVGDQQLHTASPHAERGHAFPVSHNCRFLHGIKAVEQLLPRLLPFLPRLRLLQALLFVRYCTIKACTETKVLQRAGLGLQLVLLKILLQSCHLLGHTGRCGGGGG